MRTTPDQATDPLRAALDAIVGSLDARAADRGAFAASVGYSPDHLDRIVEGAAGERPAALRRRLLLERGAWQLRGGSSVAAAASDAGYGSSAAFSRAFARAYGVPPRAFADSARPIGLEAGNGLRFHPPAGVSVPRTRPEWFGPGPTSRRLLAHHLAHGRELVAAVQALDRADRERAVRPGHRIEWFGEAEPTAQLMAERLVGALECWVAAMSGRRQQPIVPRDLVAQFDAVAGKLVELCERIDREQARDAGFVDALCEPPQMFVHADVLAAALGDLGAPVALIEGDPIHRATREPRAEPRRRDAAERRATWGTGTTGLQPAASASTEQRFPN